MASIGDVITITTETLGSRPAPARRAIIARTDDLGEDGVYGAWFYPRGVAKLSAFDGTAYTDPTLIAIRDREFAVIGHVSGFSASTLRKLARLLRDEDSDLHRHHEGQRLRYIITEHLRSAS